MDNHISILFVRRLIVACAIIPLLLSCSTDSYKQGLDTPRRHGEPPEKWLGNIADRDVHDPYVGATREDYYDSFFNHKAQPKSEPPKPIMPDVSDLLVAPPEPIVNEDKLISIAVTEDVPIKDVLVELARKADLDVEIDPGISGGIIFRAKDKPFKDVIDRISNLAGLRYEFDGDVLRISRDTPYMVNYKLNLLNMTRNQSSNITIDTSVTGGGEAGAGTGSSSSLEITSEDDDIWVTVESGVNAILIQQDNFNIKAAEADSSEAIIEDATSSIGSVVINRRAGLVSVTSSQRKHKRIREFLDYISLSASSQVLIEAKIIEVSLDDSYRSGIDWSQGVAGSSNLSLSSNFDFLNISDSNLTDQLLTIGVVDNDLIGSDKNQLSATLQFAESFGTVKTLSSPRLHAMNNQFAVLTFAENRVFFTLDVETDTIDLGGGVTEDNVTVSSERESVPIGVILTLQPSIDLVTNEIIMNVRPTLSRVIDEISDPASIFNVITSDAADADKTFLLAELDNIPIIEVRELDSILRINSGEVMVIGGLIEERTTNIDTGVPGLSNIPLLGNAFKSVNKSTEAVETVIFMKATIIPGSGVSVEDANFYKEFTRNREL